MKCLLKYRWVKLPRDIAPKGKGIMGDWIKLASRAAFRNGQARYCGHINEVSAGMWAGGVVGLKSILKQKNRTKALETLDKLSQLGYVNFELDQDTKKLAYRINDWVVECSGAPCSNGAAYATEGYGFLCIPRNITQRLVDQGHVFEDADAWLDLWCHTIFEDPRNAFSYLAPAVQFGNYGAALTLDTLGRRWRWEKTKVWRFLQKNRDAFTLHKLPGSYGCIIFNALYPTVTGFSMPSHQETVRILEDIRIRAGNTHFPGSDNERINRMTALHSKAVSVRMANPKPLYQPDNNVASRVAFSGPIYTRAYLSQCWNCKHCITDCWVSNRAPGITKHPQKHVRGPCPMRTPRYPFKEAE